MFAGDLQDGNGNYDPGEPPNPLSVLPWWNTLPWTGDNSQGISPRRRLLSHPPKKLDKTTPAASVETQTPLALNNMDQISTTSILAGDKSSRAKSNPNIGSRDRPERDNNLGVDLNERHPISVPPSPKRVTFPGLDTSPEQRRKPLIKKQEHIVSVVDPKPDQSKQLIRKQNYPDKGLIREPGTRHERQGKESSPEHRRKTQIQRQDHTSCPPFTLKIDSCEDDDAFLPDEVTTGDHFTSNPHTTINRTRSLQDCEIIGQTSDIRFPWQRDVGVQCEILPSVAAFILQSRDSGFSEASHPLKALKTCSTQTAASNGHPRHKSLDLPSPRTEEAEQVKKSRTKSSSDAQTVETSGGRDRSPMVVCDDDIGSVSDLELLMGAGPINDR